MNTHSIDRTQKIAGSTYFRQRLLFLSWPLALLVTLIPAIVKAEGAVRLLDCSIVKVCDGTGECRAESRKLNFRMEPITVQSDGSGRYTLRYGTSAATMEASSTAGPFLWKVREQRNALLASSETEFLWHQLELDPTPRATIRFLKCSFHQ